MLLSQEPLNTYILHSTAGLFFPTEEEEWLEYTT